MTSVRHHLDKPLAKGLHHERACTHLHPPGLCNTINFFPFLSLPLPRPLPLSFPIPLTREETCTIAVTHLFAAHWHSRKTTKRGAIDTLRQLLVDNLLILLSYRHMLLAPLLAAQRGPLGMTTLGQATSRALMMQAGVGRIRSSPTSLARTLVSATTYPTRRTDGLLLNLRGPYPHFHPLGLADIQTL